MKVVRLSARRLYPQEIFLVLISVGDHGGTVVKELCYKSKFASSIPDGVIEIFH